MNCPDCQVRPFALHIEGCDVERCRNCGTQRISCDCSDDLKYPSLPWTGEYPGVIECQEFDLWSLWDDRRGWVKCSRSTPGATEDLNSLPLACDWDRETGRWVSRTSRQKPPAPGEAE